MGDKSTILRNIVDVRDKRRSEAYYGKNEKLQYAVRAVSHDLKTPVVSIHGFSDRLLRDDTGRS